MYKLRYTHTLTLTHTHTHTLTHTHRHRHTHSHTHTHRHTDTHTLTHTHTHTLSDPQQLHPSIPGVIKSLFNCQLTIPQDVLKQQDMNNFTPQIYLTTVAGSNLYTKDTVGAAVCGLNSRGSPLSSQISQWLQSRVYRVE